VFETDTEIKCKTDRHDITEILLKVVLNTINPNPYSYLFYFFSDTRDIFTVKMKVVSSIPRLSGIRTHNVSGDRH
jgi:uncharacterized membrane protein